MSYLEEWDRIEQMIDNHNTSKSTVITSEKRQALALSHIAKCLSVFADDITGAHANIDSIRRCGECVYQGNTEHCASCQILFNVTGFAFDPSKCVESVTCNKKDEEATGYRNCASCSHYYNSIHQEPCFSCSRSGSNWEPKEATDKKPCNNCIHSNEEDELNCGVCDENHSEYKPFGFRGKDEIMVECPIYTRIFTVRKTSDKLLYLLCPTCSTSFTYDVDTNIMRSYID